MQNNEFFKYATKHQGINSLTLHDYTNTVIKNMTPVVTEERQLNVTVMDVFSRLMMDRIIFLGTAVDDTVCNIINAQLLFLESADANKDVSIYINSPGGSVYAGLGLYDVMQYVQMDVATVCTGLAASMGAVLLAAGTEGKRCALPHSRIMIHQPLGGASGQASDIEITYNQIKLVKDDLYQILAKHTKQTVEKVGKDSDRDYWMRANEAKEYGLIDEVMIKKIK